MNPKISIIVPVYKVEPYIHKCIDSILSQTFTDFELILVDDGSPDNCGKICDQYADLDERIKVIHKDNGGLSDARNAGMDIAIGDYIGFVDSDDWIESDMYELLYNMCLENNCDIACCSSKIHYTNKTVLTGRNEFRIFNHKQAMEEMLKAELFDEVVWTKLFKRSLVKDIRFSVGKIYEDTGFTYKVIHKSKQLCYMGEPKYNYIKREEGLMNQALKNMRTDSVIIYDEMYKFISSHYPDLCKIVALKLAENAMVILNLITFNKNYKKFKVEYLYVAKKLNEYFFRVIGLHQFSKNVKILLMANKIHPLIYKFLVSFSLRRKSI